MLTCFVQLTRRKDQAKDQENARYRKINSKEKIQDVMDPTLLGHLPTSYAWQFKGTFSITILKKKKCIDIFRRLR